LFMIKKIREEDRKNHTTCEPIEEFRNDCVVWTSPYWCSFQDSMQQRRICGRILAIQA